ncbi:MAG: 4-alpha-glucanotransferase [bacterium]
MSKKCCSAALAPEKTLPLTYTETVSEALKLLDKKLCMIIHGSSFPSVNDTGMGSPFSHGGRNFITYLENLGFTGIQLGPDGKTKSIDMSPYASTMFSTNPLFIDIEALTKEEWDNILSKETFEEIVNNKPENSDINRVEYSYIFSKQESALKEAFSTYQKKLASSKVLQELDKKLKAYVEENQFWLEKDAMYEALSIAYNNDYWPLWTNETDKKLFCPSNEAEAEQAKVRIAEIKKEYANEIAFYEFCQFVVFEQKEQTKEFALSHGINTIADIQVAFSDRDSWSAQSYFLKGWNLGCPPDLFSKSGQLWGFPVFNPENVVKKDGTLGEAGKLLKARYEKVFKENPGGARIDHAVGLIDPYVYKDGISSAAPKYGASRLFSSPTAHENDACKELEQYSRITSTDLDLTEPVDSEFRVKTSALDRADVVNRYAEVIEKVILAAAKEYNQDKENVIFEDLGTITTPVAAVLDKFGLTGIRVTQFVVPEKPEHIYRGINIDSHHCVTPGTHDNAPLRMWATELFKTNTAQPHIDLVAQDLFEDEAQRNEFKHKFVNSSLEEKVEAFVYAKYLEIFSTRASNIQISFADYFGIDKTYNRPGANDPTNWTLRVPNDYSEFYRHQLNSNVALNIPQILADTIKLKYNKLSAEEKAQADELLAKLNKLAQEIKA